MRGNDPVITHLGPCWYRTGRAEALRRAEMAMDSANQPEFSHPLA
ncbi:MAG: hypothetical protein WDO24_05090 [Pseudomonadota bacterium]